MSSEASHKRHLELIMCPPDIETFLEEEIDYLQYELNLYNGDDELYPDSLAESLFGQPSVEDQLAQAKEAERLRHCIADLRLTQELLDAGDASPALDVLLTRIQDLEAKADRALKQGHSKRADRIEVQRNKLSILYADQQERFGLEPLRRYFANSSSDEPHE